MTEITPENLIRHELIGLKAHVVESDALQLVSTRGLVIDETRNTIRIETRRGNKTVPKSVATIDFTLPDGRVVRVEGARLLGRSESRLKARVRRW